MYKPIVLAPHYFIPFTLPRTFTYDAADRLASAIAGGGSGGFDGLDNYTYDVTTGNLSSKAGVSYTYLDDAHRHAVTHLNGVQKYWYDTVFANGKPGNMTQRVVGSSTYNLTEPVLSAAKEPGEPPGVSELSLSYRTRRNRRLPA